MSTELKNAVAAMRRAVNGSEANGDYEVRPFERLHNAQTLERTPQVVGISIVRPDTTSSGAAGHTQYDLSWDLFEKDPAKLTASLKLEVKEVGPKMRVLPPRGTMVAHDPGYPGRAAYSAGFTYEPHTTVVSTDRTFSPADLGAIADVLEKTDFVERDTHRPGIWESVKELDRALRGA